MFLKFLVVGSCTVILDGLVYGGLGCIGVKSAYAKSIGFIIGTLFAFFANQKWTFRTRYHHTQPWMFALLYGISLWINVWVNSWALASLPWIASFVLATACSATCNFWGMKWIVFKQV